MENVNCLTDTIDILQIQKLKLKVKNISANDCIKKHTLWNNTV